MFGFLKFFPSALLSLCPRRDSENDELEIGSRPDHLKGAFTMPQVKDILGTDWGPSRATASALPLRAGKNILPGPTPLVPKTAPGRPQMWKKPSIEGGNGARRLRAGKKKLPGPPATAPQRCSEEPPGPPSWHRWAPEVVDGQGATPVGYSRDDQLRNDIFRDSVLMEHKEFAEKTESRSLKMHAIQNSSKRGF